MTTPLLLPHTQDRAPYTLERLRAEMAEHHQNLRKALLKHGLRRGVLTLGQYRSAVNALAPARAYQLGSMNPYARQVWASALYHSIHARGLDTGPLFMLTALHHPWHSGWHRWAFDLGAIVARSRVALAGLSYVLLIEVAPLTFFGHRYFAPHLHGLLFEDLSRRRHDRLASHFAGGLGGADPLVLRPVYDLAGACLYCAKPPTHMDVCYAAADGLRRHRGRRLWLTEHFSLWQHLHGFTYPDLTFAGGLGTRVLRSALLEAGAEASPPSR